MGNHKLKGIRCNLLKSIHSILINVHFHEEDFRGVLLRVAPRVCKNGEFIKSLAKKREFYEVNLIPNVDYSY